MEKTFKEVAHYYHNTDLMGVFVFLKDGEWRLDFEESTPSPYYFHTLGLYHNIPGMKKLPLLHSMENLYKDEETQKMILEGIPWNEKMVKKIIHDVSANYTFSWIMDILYAQHYNCRNLPKSEYLEKSEHEKAH